MRLLGTITTPAGTSTTNASTAVPFAMPRLPCSVVVVPAATGLTLKFGADSDATQFPLTTVTRSLPWAGRENGRMALWNTTGAPIACKVFATDGPGLAAQV